MLLLSGCSGWKEVYEPRYGESATNIIAFSILGINGTIVTYGDNLAETPAGRDVTGTIEVKVPVGTDLKSLIPTITTYPGAIVSPASGVAQDFTSPLLYTVTADRSTTVYTVTVKLTDVDTQNNNTINDTTATLVSLSITPASGSVGIGYAQQLTATGAYSDGSTDDLTSVVAWTISSSSVASISSGGVLTGISVGNVDITADTGEITSQPISYTVSTPSSGSLDLSFGTGGVAVGSFYHGISSAALMSDGKIAIVGYVQPVQNSNKKDFALGIYNSAGNLFQDIHTPISTNHDFAHAVSVQTDGKIILGGGSNCSANTSSYFYEEEAYLCSLLALVRYNSDGSLDGSFGIGGKATTTIPGSSGSMITGLAIQSDGKIVVTGSFNYNSGGDKSKFLIARYTTSGQLDGTFGSGGVVTTQLGSETWNESHSIKIQNDGKILVAGLSAAFYWSGNANFALVRYNTNGTLDTSFDGDGIATTSLGTGDDVAFDLEIQSDDKIILAGKTYYEDYYGGNTAFGLVRYNSNGSLDNSFGSLGKVTINFNSNNVYNPNFAYSLAIQADNKIIVGGSYEPPFYRTLAITRLNTDGSVDNSFGKMISNWDQKRIKKILLQQDDKIIIVGGRPTGVEDTVIIKRYWP